MPSIFTKIIDREIPADILYEDEVCLAFRDVSPQAPTHFLVIPRKEIVSLADLSDEDEAIVGRFYEMVVAEGGNYLNDKKKPIFNSEAGQRALQWFVDLYKAKAVPAGTTSYVWDDLGQGFASGTIALNLDWPG